MALFTGTAGVPPANVAIQLPQMTHTSVLGATLAGATPAVPVKSFRQSEQLTAL